MREFTIHKNDADQRLDRFLLKAVPLLPASLAQKYIRLKRIKVNGARAERDYRLREGDRLQLYLNDEFFEAPSEENVYLTIANPKLHILYEDENILLLDKPAGLVVHADEGEKVNTLVNHMLAYLYQKREWKPREENAFTPALCNRIDRNTGGIVIAAKNAEALRIMDEKVKNREIEKIYLAAVVGTPRPAAGRLEGYLFKDAKNNQVYVYDAPRTGAKTAVTEYKTIASDGRLTLVECRLITGRTHQIRAQFRHAGCPLLGDGKYGREKDNRAYGEKGQALCSWRLRFVFDTPAGALEYLNGKSFRTKTPEFVEKYFPTFAERMKT